MEVRRSVYLWTVLLVIMLTVVNLQFAFAKKLVVASFYPIDKVSGWDGVVREFKKLHPEVTEIEVQVTSWNEYLPKLLTQIASGTAPDVVAVENTPFPEFVAKGVIRDITSYMEKTKGFSKKDFFSHLLDRYTVDGKIYGIPYDCQPQACLFYNKKLFDEAGVSHPNDTWRWEDLLKAAQKLTKKTGDRIAQYGFDPQGNWQYFVYTNGGYLVDNIKKPTKCVLDSSRAIGGVQFYVDLMYKYEVSPSPAMIQSSGATSTDLFLTGRIAMSYNGFWQAVEHPKQFKEMNAGLALAPAGPTGIRRYPTGGTAYCISSTSKEPDLAWDFITVYMGPLGHKAAYESATLGAIYPPAHIPSFNWYVSRPNLFIENIKVNGIGARYAIFAPFDARWPEISSRYITPEMDLILRNQKPVAPTMKSISEEVTKALQGK